MKVMKFGGSSVGSLESIARVIELIGEAIKSDKCVVVFSAMKGVTDALIEGGKMAEAGSEGYREVIRKLERKHIEVIHELIPIKSQSPILSQTKFQLNEVEGLYESVSNLGELSPRSLDRILSAGEFMISRIIAAKFASGGTECSWKDPRKLIVTDSNFGRAAVDLDETNERMRRAFEVEMEEFAILPGFVGADSRGLTTTLGRGGGDLSAAIAAAALDADVLEIWTDVSGMMTADPRLVRNVSQIPEITYHEAIELCHFGAKIIYPPTLQPVRDKGIPILIRNTFEPGAAGTTVGLRANYTEGSVRGITSIDDISILSLEGSGMVGVPGYSKRLFEVLSVGGINVILITQASSEHSICVGVESRHAELAKRAIDTEFESEIIAGRLDPVVVEKEVSIVAVVGDKMRYHTGISGRVFSSLGGQGINIRAIAQGSSERNISAVISSKDVRKAVNILHEEFFSDGGKQVNLFVAGVGAVGSAFLDQIAAQSRVLRETLGLDLRLRGLVDSKRFIVADEGLDLNDWRSLLTDAPSAGHLTTHIEDFADGIIKLNCRNSIFVDLTASSEVAGIYGRLLRKSIGVVACNKIAASSGFTVYRELKDLAREFNTSFLFEANVGAGLPVIGTLRDLISSGDRIEKIEGMLSGSLNYIFGSYDGSVAFASIVREAQRLGYTEPDPRADLSGLDVARKILILARESGARCEMSDVTLSGFLPKACLAGDIDRFFSELEKHEDHFKAMLEKTIEGSKKLRFLSSFDPTGLRAGLYSIDPESDLATLAGTDNVIAFHTARYKDRPLVIKGAGAGPAVTAAGVFADVIRASRH